MTTVLTLLLVQCVMGACDSLWHHELEARLAHKRSARRELLLHSCREFLYAIIFFGLAWREWRGIWAGVLSALLLIEVLLTVADFLEEDRTRRLPATERVLHTMLAVNYGVWLGVFVPRLYDWARQESALAAASYGWQSTLLTIAAAGVLMSAARNGYAALLHSRPPYWVRHPFYVARRRSARTYLVTGATGFIGTALVRKLLGHGDGVIVLSRDGGKALERFGPHVRTVESLAQLDETARIDGIVNLAGARILAFPWTRGRRRKLLDSRLGVTREVVRLCRRLQRPPEVLVSGSAIGFYGTRDGEECDEGSGPRTQFQSELCQRWEGMAADAEPVGVRVVLLRTGLVLGTAGGAVPMLSLPVRLMAGATLGSGVQWVSWIHIDDVVRMIELALERTSLHGALNATAPRPVRHSQFQHSLAQSLHRPLWARIPGWPLRAVLGEMTDLLLRGQRVVPRKALTHGFQFKYPELDGALAGLFGGRQLRIAARPAEVYFNGECPVCNAEMTHYAGIASNDSLPICFIDSMREQRAFVQYGLSVEHLERRVYLRDAHGRVSSGFEALLKLWLMLPRYRWLAHVLAMPPIRQVATAGYDLIVAPFLAWLARRRRSSLMAAR
jgi:uncharacterized protein (TIGR01777 family)